MSCQFWQGAAKTAIVETICGGLAVGFDEEDLLAGDLRDKFLEGWARLEWRIDWALFFSSGAGCAWSEDMGGCLLGAGRFPSERKVCMSDKWTGSHDPIFARISGELSTNRKKCRRLPP